MTTISFDRQVVAFLDILGYRELVNLASESTGYASEIIDRLETALSLGVWESIEMAFPSDVADYRSRTRAQIFSDSVYLSLNCLDLPSESLSGHLFSLVLALVHLQAELALRDIIIRGGVSVGMHYDSGKVLFSQGLTRAYTLESEAAIYPRILLDDEVVQLLRMNSDEEDYPHIDELVKQDVDGQFFVDYLSYHVELRGKEEQEEFFRRHKNMAEARLVNARDSRIREKLLWIANYHNWKLKAMGVTSEELFVEQDALSMRGGVFVPRFYVMIAQDSAFRPRALLIVPASTLWEARAEATRHLRGRDLVAHGHYRVFDDQVSPDSLEELVGELSLSANDVEVVEQRLATSPR